MWNRQQVKEQVKLIMKRNYWKMFVITLLAGTLTGEKTTIIERVQNFASNNLSYDTSPIFYSSNFQYIFYSFISIASILGILYTIFIGRKSKSICIRSFLFVQTNDYWTKDGFICLRFILFRMDHSRFNLLWNWNSICTTLSRSYKS